MSAAHSWAVLRPYWTVRLAKRDDDASSQRDCASRVKKRGRSGGGNRIALEAAGKPCFEVVARGGYAAKTDFPRSLAMAWRSI
jgi:hypothetical protein